MDIRIEIAARIYAIKYGAISLKELVEWADHQIQIEEHPHSNFIDVSLAKTLGEALSALNKFEATEDISAVAQIAFRFFYQSLCSGLGNYQLIAHGLYNMAMDGFIPKPEIEGAMWSFWDSLDLAVAGVVGDPEEVKSEILAFLKENKG
jgi:hypothetical protein